VPKDESSTDGSRGSQGQTRLRSETSANDEAKKNMKKGLEEVLGPRQEDGSQF
jgi:hypothetical protein